MKTKRCQSFCGRVLKLSEFSPNKQYGKKRHPYCRKCCAKKTRLHRESLKQIPNRKPSVIWKCRSAGPADKVIFAIRNGRNTQSQIMRYARLRADVLDDILARLILDERKVKSEIIDGERLYFERIAA